MVGVSKVKVLVHVVLVVLPLDVFVSTSSRTLGLGDVISDLTEARSGGPSVVCCTVSSAGVSDVLPVVTAEDFRLWDVAREDT